MNNALSKLQVGLTAYYEGDMYDEETGDLIPEAVTQLGLTLEEFDFYQLVKGISRLSRKRHCTLRL